MADDGPKVGDIVRLRSGGSHMVVTHFMQVPLEALELFSPVKWEQRTGLSTGDFSV